jgi:hypothetical protein
MVTRTIFERKDIRKAIFVRSELAMSSRVLTFHNNTQLLVAEVSRANALAVSYMCDHDPKMLETLLRDNNSILEELKARAMRGNMRAIEALELVERKMPQVYTSRTKPIKVSDEDRSTKGKHLIEEVRKGDIDALMELHRTDRIQAQSVASEKGTLLALYLNNPLNAYELAFYADRGLKVDFPALYQILRQDLAARKKTPAKTGRNHMTGGL